MWVPMILGIEWKKIFGSQIIIGSLYIKTHEWKFSEK